jgi:hypothetical protein
VPCSVIGRSQRGDEMLTGRKKLQRELTAQEKIARAWVLKAQRDRRGRARKGKAKAA